MTKTLGELSNQDFLPEEAGDFVLVDYQGYNSVHRLDQIRDYYRTELLTEIQENLSAIRESHKSKHGLNTMAFLLAQDQLIKSYLDGMEG